MGKIVGNAEPMDLQMARDYLFILCSFLVHKYDAVNSTIGSGAVRLSSSNQQGESGDALLESPYFTSPKNRADFSAIDIPSRF
jgi:hypothetical protein